MKTLSFKILVFCVLFPPLLNIATIYILEEYFKAIYTRKIQGIYTGNTKFLFDGSIRLKDAIQLNIDNFLKRKHAPRFGLKVIPKVTTKNGSVLYPSTFEPSSQNILAKPPLTIAIENYNLLSRGLELQVDTRIEYGTPISLLILLFYILSSLGLLTFFYRRSIVILSKEEQFRNSEIERLVEIEKKSQKHLEKLKKQQEIYSDQLIRIQDELEDHKAKASAVEDELLEELVEKENEIEKNLLSQQEQQEEIDSLKEKIEQYERDIKKNKSQRQKEREDLSKRFSTLYKNIMVHTRAIDGYIELPDELKIKAEEIVHQLNHDPKIVTIKRKVFGKKNRETVLEVLFAYKGRLYFRNTHKNRVEVLVIGTKHTQSKDLSFLNNL
jgi:predicted  nucleic acid-binding Zn-ribbon protein